MTCVFYFFYSGLFLENMTKPEWESYWTTTDKNEIHITIFSAEPLFQWNPVSSCGDKP